MVTIPLGIGDWDSPAENISRLRLHNMYLTENPRSPDGVSRVSRPTLAEFAEVGDGPIHAIWRQDATFNGDWLIVSGTELYRFNETTKVATLIDTLPGTSRCQFAGTGDRVLIARDGVAYSTDGENITIVLMPDDVPEYEDTPAPVQSVACINSYFLLSVRNSQRFYWILPGEVDPDPLDFASAERTPDDIESINILMDEIWMIGTSAPEVWIATSDSDNPFARISGRVYDEGCASRDTIATGVANNLPCLFWVTDTRTVVLAQGTPQKISTEAIEEKLKIATNLRGYTFRHNRHDFYILTSDQFTYAYDIISKQWGRWDTYHQVNFCGDVALMSGSSVYVGDYTSNAIYVFEEGVSDYGLPVIREISGQVPNPGKSIKCSNVIVRVNAGWSPQYSFSPSLEMRWSDDQGASFSDYIVIPLGDKGFYNTDTIFRSLGLINRPGRDFEFRFSDQARFRIDYAVMNEA